MIDLSAALGATLERRVRAGEEIRRESEHLGHDQVLGFGLHAVEQQLQGKRRIELGIADGISNRVVDDDSGGGLFDGAELTTDRRPGRAAEANLCPAVVSGIDDDEVCGRPLDQPDRLLAERDRLVEQQRAATVKAAHPDGMQAVAAIRSVPGDHDAPIGGHR